MSKLTLEKSPVAPETAAAWCRRRDYDYSTRGNLRTPNRPYAIEALWGVDRFGVKRYFQRGTYRTLEEAQADLPSSNENPAEIYVRKTGETVAVELVAASGFKAACDVFTPEFRAEMLERANNALITGQLKYSPDRVAVSWPDMYIAVVEALDAKDAEIASLKATKTP